MTHTETIAGARVHPDAKSGRGPGPEEMFMVGRSYDEMLTAKFSDACEAALNAAPPAFALVSEADFECLIWSIVRITTYPCPAVPSGQAWFYSTSGDLVSKQSIRS